MYRPNSVEVTGTVTVNQPITVDVNQPVTVDGEVAVTQPVTVDGTVGVTGDVEQPDRGDIFTVDLADARTASSLSKSGSGLTILEKGDGTWTLIFVFADASTASLSSANVVDGDSVNIDFSDLQFTNTAQVGATDPVFWREWRA